MWRCIDHFNIWPAGPHYPRVRDASHLTLLAVPPAVVGNLRVENWWEIQLLFWNPRWAWKGRHTHQIPVYLSAFFRQWPPALLLHGAWDMPYVFLNCLCSLPLQFKPMYILYQWEMQLVLTVFCTSYRVKLQIGYASIFPAPLFSDLLSCLACLKAWQH